MAKKKANRKGYFGSRRGLNEAEAQRIERLTDAAADFWNAMELEDERRGDSDLVEMTEELRVISENIELPRFDAGDDWEDDWSDLEEPYHRMRSESDGWFQEVDDWYLPEPLLSQALDGLDEYVARMTTPSQEVLDEWENWYSRIGKTPNIESAENSIGANEDSDLEGSRL